MSPGSDRITYQFGGFECHAPAYELRRKGHRIRLARQPMDLLLLLVRRAGELVTRDEIARHIWAENVFVDLDAGIRTAVLKIRQALDDSGGVARFVETVPGKGYRFIAPVVAVPWTPSASPTASRAAKARTTARCHNLPADLTSFVGREEPLAELRRLLPLSRLLTLTGSGGVGKTRLAIRLASDVAAQFRDGVYMVDLASIAAPELVLQTVATVFSVRESPQRSLRDAVVDDLRDRELLLLLDTCEHLLDGCTELAEMLLRAAPALRIVATSREAFSAPGETVYRVPPLVVPEPAALLDAARLSEYEATRLFLTRAKAAHTEFDAHSEPAAIAAICHRLDGIPLAIELAAAQTASLSPQQIETRLAHGLPTTITRTSVTRQRTLEATIRWSYELLSAPERLLFDRLSAFSTSWTLEAAEHVCFGEGVERAQLPELLSRLLDKSLVVPGADSLGIRRYRFLETIRHFARARLEQTPATSRIRDRHFEFFHQQFRSGFHQLSGSDQATCLRRLHAEQDNVRAALDWGLSSPMLGEKAVELAGALFWFWIKRGLFEEGRQWLGRAATVPAAGELQARVALGLGHVSYFQGRHDEMTARNNEVLTWGRENGDTLLAGMALFGHALATFERGAFEESVAFAHAAREASGDRFPAPLLVLGNVALVHGEPERALAFFEEAVDGLRHVGDLWGLGIVLSLAAGLRIIRGDFDAARDQAAEAMSISVDLEDSRGIAWSLDVFAGLRAAATRAEDAARLWGASDGLLQKVGGTLPPTIGWIRDRYLESARQSLGDAAFAAAMAEGRGMAFVDAIALVRR